MNKRIVKNGLLIVAALAAAMLALYGSLWQMQRRNRKEERQAQSLVSELGTRDVREVLALAAQETSEPSDPVQTSPAEAAGGEDLWRQALDERIAVWSAQLTDNTVEPLSAKELATLQSVFENTIFFGDSMTEAISGNGIFPDSFVISKRSATIDVLTQLIPEVAAAYPRNVVVFTGLNDCNHYTDLNDYERDYRIFLEGLQSCLTGGKLYVCSLLPPNNEVEASRADLARSELFDQRLAGLCGEYGAVYVDTNWMVRQQHYMVDGIHMDPAFYTILIRYLEFIFSG